MQPTAWDLSDGRLYPGFHRCSHWRSSRRSEATRRRVAPRLHARYLHHFPRQLSLRRPAQSPLAMSLVVPQRANPVMTSCGWLGLKGDEFASIRCNCLARNPATQGVGSYPSAVCSNRCAGLFVGFCAPRSNHHLCACAVKGGSDTPTNASRRASGKCNLSLKSQIHEANDRRRGLACPVRPRIHL